MATFLFLSFLFVFSNGLFCFSEAAKVRGGSPVTYLWPSPAEFTSGNETLSVDPALSLVVAGTGGSSGILRLAFDRYKEIVFKNTNGVSGFVDAMRQKGPTRRYAISKVRVVVASESEELQFGVDESYILLVLRKDGKAVVGEATIEANTVYGALRGLELGNQGRVEGLESLSFQLKANKPCADDHQIETPSLISSHLDTSRHYLPIHVIKQVIESMSYAKLNVLHWHIIDKESFPLEVPSYPKLWKGTYSQWERYTIEDAYEIVNFARLRGINVMAEVDVPGHAESWLNEHNMTSEDAYQYFVLRAQQIAISKNWTPVNWEETFNDFPTTLNPRTVVHNWLGGGVCPKAVDRGFRCIFSNQGVWYLDHLDVPWNATYNAEPLEGIHDPSKQELVIGGEVCMWGETADASNVQQTIWPRAATAAERLWSPRKATSNIETALPRLHYFRCLLNRRGVQAAPVDNFYARSPPTGAGSCYVQ